MKYPFYVESRYSLDGTLKVSILTADEAQSRDYEDNYEDCREDCIIRVDGARDVEEAKLYRDLLYHTTPFRMDEQLPPEHNLDLSHDDAGSMYPAFEMGGTGR